MCVIAKGQMTDRHRSEATTVGLFHVDLCRLIVNVRHLFRSG